MISNIGDISKAFWPVAFRIRVRLRLGANSLATKQAGESVSLVVVRTSDARSPKADFNFSTNDSTLGLVVSSSLSFSSSSQSSDRSPLAIDFRGFSANSVRCITTHSSIGSPNSSTSMSCFWNISRCGDPSADAWLSAVM